MSPRAISDRRVIEPERTKSLHDFLVCSFLTTEEYFKYVYGVFQYIFGGNRGHSDLFCGRVERFCSIKQLRGWMDNSHGVTVKRIASQFVV